MGPGLLWSVWACVTAQASMPLVSVDFGVDVKGGLAEVRVEQTFVNDGDHVIEAVYVFPLHEEAAVDGMRMVVGDNVIEGQILEVGAARAVYDGAIEEGYTAALTTQQRPNVFTQTVGNIGPGEEVRVQLRVVQPVPHVDGAYELVLPLVTAPRFVTGRDWASFEATLDAPDAVWGPPVAVEGTSTTAGIDVHIDAGLPFTSFDCPSHQIETGRFGETARLVTTRAPLDRDFVLRWSVTPDRPDAAMWVTDEHLMLTFGSPDAPPRSEIVPRELIWVLDQSCSMEGEPIALVREAMHEALRYVDGRDSIRILRFSDHVWGRGRSVRATWPVRYEAHREIANLHAQGGTYLLDGVLAALRTRPDPGRERTVVFMTDGLVSNERNVLAAIADHVGSARLFAFGVGPASNRWLLDEMARFGGGKTTWLRSDESPEAAVARFVDTLSKPVLTDIAIDWGDWQVEEVWPRRLPALYAGQPLLVTARVVHRGRAPVVLRGRLGDGTYANTVLPIEVEGGRAIASTWARQKIANLERDLVWGDVPEIRAEILDTSLEYQVLSQYTAFVAVDRTRVVRPPGAPQETVEQPVEAPAGTTHWASLPHAGGATEELVVMAKAQALSTESTSTGQTISKEYLQRIPAGRTYQTAVQTVSGVLGAGASPTAGLGAANETTTLLDGANVTDPVSGTAALNVNLDAMEQIEVLTGGMMPEIGGASGPVVNLVSRSPTNNLELEAEVLHMQRVAEGPTLVGDGVSAALSGPLVRDRAWAAVSTSFDRTTLGARQFEGGGATTRWVVQPNPDHRFSASLVGDAATVEDGPTRSSQVGGLGMVRWQWFLSPSVNTHVLASEQLVAIGDETRGREQAHVHLSALAVDDPLGGTHDLKAGIDIERARWTVDPEWVRAWLGVDVAEAGAVSRTGLFAQDSYKPSSNLTINFGARGDVALDRVHVGPRLYAAWDPFGDQRTKLASGWGRRFGGIGLATSVVEPERGLSRLDEWIAGIERELVEDVAIGAHGYFRIARGLPAYGGVRVDQRTAGAELVLRKIQSRRWAAQLRWRTASLLMRTGDRAVVDDGTMAGFADTFDGFAFWDLPSDPFTTSVGLVGAWFGRPLGSQLVDPSRGIAPVGRSWSGGLSVRQCIDVRKGQLVAELTGRYVSVVDGSLDMTEWPVVPLAMLDGLPGWEGPRLEAALRYEF